MRELTSHKVEGTANHVIVEQLSDPGAGGACHTYRLTPLPAEGQRDSVTLKFMQIGKPGITNEALLAIVADRLNGFQSGEFACDENQEALEHTAAALEALKRRTADRVSRKVEGKLEV